VLEHPYHFRGTSYNLPAAGPATSSRVNFSSNFLPVKGGYGPADPDLRANPSVRGKELSLIGRSGSLITPSCEPAYVKDIAVMFGISSKRQFSRYI
jgi:hypothetical protein